MYVYIETLLSVVPSSWNNKIHLGEHQQRAPRKTSTWMFVFFWWEKKTQMMNRFACLLRTLLSTYRLNWSADQARRSLPQLSLDKTALKNSCPESITCPSSNVTIKYRPIDGSCHNLFRPDWGKANTPFQRALPNAYSDGSFNYVRSYFILFFDVVCAWCVVCNVWQTNRARW